MKRSRVAIAGIAVAAVTSAVLLVPAASATSTGRNTIDSRDEAIAALDETQHRLDEIRAYLKSLPASPSTPPTTPPTTTSAPPSSTTTPPPTTSDGVTAATTLGWGTPLPASDEFNTPGAPDPKKWGTYNGTGHANNGRRVAANNTVQNGFLRQTGKANGDSAGMASHFDQQYGRWEARVRSTSSSPAASKQYHPVLIVWPKSEKWPQDGEYDFLENSKPGDDCAEVFAHYPHNPGRVQQEHAVEKNCGAPLSEWHNIAFEWTPQFIRGFVDGKEFYRFSGGATSTRKAIQAMPSGHATIQLDNFFGSGMTPATFDVDWMRIYKL